MQWKEEPSCFHTDLSLEYLGRGDGKCHKFTRLLHSETICLVHWHATDCQCFRVMAASFGQTHVSFENVQHSVLFYGDGHYKAKCVTIINSVYIYVRTYFNWVQPFSETTLIKSFETI